MELDNEQSNKTLEELIASLNDQSEQVQWAAAEALGNLGDPRAVEPLISALSVQHWRVRCSSTQALGRLRDPRAVNALIAVFNQSLIDMPSRLAAAEALGAIGDQRAVASLVNALRREDLDTQATQTLANALQRLGIAPQAVMAERSVRVRQREKGEAREKAGKQVLWGLGLSVGGILITFCTYSLAASSTSGGYYVVCTGPIIFGIILFLIGSIRWLVNRA